MALFSHLQGRFVFLYTSDIVVDQCYMTLTPNVTQVLPMFLDWGLLCLMLNHPQNVYHFSSFMYLCCIGLFGCIFPLVPMMHDKHLHQWGNDL